jgi:hypothetical protein
MAIRFIPVVGCTSSRIQMTHSLKPPGYNRNPCAYEVKNRFHKLCCFKCNLYRYVEDNCQRGCTRPWAVLARGEDAVGHYELMAPPSGLCTDEDVARIQSVIDANNNFASLYAAKFR